MVPRSRCAADFPYDARVRGQNLSGLDRLRAIPDRELAEYLYRLHACAERNEIASRENPLGSSPQRGPLVRVTRRALAGELGPEARELATYLLLDEAGRERTDDSSLAVFVRALQELRKSQR